MKSLFKNCLSVSENDGWFTPLRFTEKQVEAFSFAEATRIRAFSPSSVCLAFKTEATKISFEYRIKAKARAFAVFDLLYDGVLVSSVSLDSDVGTVEFSLCATPDTEITIYIPHLVCIDIKNISADAPLCAIPDKEKLWLALGDSITQGMVARHPAFAYPSIISRHYGYDLINSGVGGVKFDEAHLDFIGREPDMITIALGCNDWGAFDREGLAENVGKYIDRLLSLYKCRNVYGILPIWRSDAEDVQCEMTFKEHCEVIRSVYEKYPFIKIIDGYKLVPPMVDFYGDPSERKLHPSDEGFMLYALGLIKEFSAEA
jgi:hypothetical protein